jgi:hypothetical protein
MTLFNVTTIEALGPRKRVHMASDWVVPALDADEAIRELRAVLDDGWGAKIVHMSKPREWSAHQPFVRMSFTMRPEDVRARIADAVKS